jgi:cytochrome c553
MKEHFTKAADMKASVIRGDLDTFKKSALWLAEHQLDGNLPATWKTHLQGMQDAARAGRDAVDMRAAAAALGATGRACAACHEQLGKPRIQVGSPPAEGSGAQLHMIRHQWAADRMWEGLMAPSDDAWIKGSEVLADAPLHKEPLAGPRSVSARVTALAKEAHDLGHRGRTIDAKERGKVYGDFLATCAACHSELGVKLN